VAPVAGGEVEEASWRLGSHVPRVARGGWAWQSEVGRQWWLLLAQGGRRPAGPVLGHKAGWVIFFAGLARQGGGRDGWAASQTRPKVEKEQELEFQIFSGWFEWIQKDI
jgi:hypothetical protein